MGLAVLALMVPARTCISNVREPVLCAACLGIHPAPQAAVQQLLSQWKVSDVTAGWLPADVMLQQQHWGSSEWQSDQYNAQSLQEAAAGSVVARGLCFANTHPAPNRFLPLKKPSVFMVQRAACANQAALLESLWSNTGRLGFRCTDMCMRPVSCALPLALCHPPTILCKIDPVRAWTVFTEFSVFDAWTRILALYLQLYCKPCSLCCRGAPRPATAQHLWVRPR